MSWKKSILIALSLLVGGFIFVGVSADIGTALVMLSLISAPILRFGTQPFLRFVKEVPAKVKNIQFKSEKQKKIVIGIGVVLMLAFFGSLLPETKTITTNTVPPPPSQEELESQRIAIQKVAEEKAKALAAKESARKELLEILSLAKQAGLVTSYEFAHLDENAIRNVVYVSNLWYTRTVNFKRDFLGKIGSLKKAATGYHHFEVRDAYSNEKVAEVTAFSGSLEVYR